MSGRFPPLTCAEVKRILKILGFTPRPSTGGSHEHWIKDNVLAKLEPGAARVEREQPEADEAHEAVGLDTEGPAPARGVGPRRGRLDQVLRHAPVVAGALATLAGAVHRRYAAGARDLQIWTVQRD